MTNKEITNGWAKPAKSRVFHYFNTSQSLCGKWSTYGRNESAIPMHKRCTECENKRPAGAF